jgi:hypothetical protein
MAFTRNARTPGVPTLPQGETIARYDTYLAAQKAVDHLADHAFAVQHVTIVGTDLQMVERVIQRLSYPRVALGGLFSGAWFGLFVGLLFSLLSTAGQSLLLPAIFIGAGFGMLFSVISYAFTRGRRDFTSSSQIVASQYAVLCSGDGVHQARALLAEVGGVVNGWPSPAAPAAPLGAPPSAPVAYDAPPAPPTGPPAPPSA